jgi:hypothetical protein
LGVEGGRRGTKESGKESKSVRKAPVKQRREGEDAQRREGEEGRRGIVKVWVLLREGRRKLIQENLPSPARGSSVVQVHDRGETKREGEGAQ